MAATYAYAIPAETWGVLVALRGPRQAGRTLRSRRCVPLAQTVGSKWRLSSNGDTNRARVALFLRRAPRGL